MDEEALEEAFPELEDELEEFDPEILENLTEEPRIGAAHNPLISLSYQKSQQIISQRVSFPYLFRYEVATLIARRAEMIEQGAPPSEYITIPPEYETNQHYAIKIAIRELHATYELKKNIIPLKIQRDLGNGDIEEWSLIDEETGEILLALRDFSLNEDMF